MNKPNIILRLQKYLLHFLNLFTYQNWNHSLQAKAVRRYWCICDFSPLKLMQNMHKRWGMLWTVYVFTYSLIRLLSWMKKIIRHEAQKCIYKCSFLLCLYLRSCAHSLLLFSYYSLWAGMNESERSKRLACRVHMNVRALYPTRPKPPNTNNERISYIWYRNYRKLKGGWMPLINPISRWRGSVFPRSKS